MEPDTTTNFDEVQQELRQSDSLQSLLETWMEFANTNLERLLLQRQLDQFKLERAQAENTSALQELKANSQLQSSVLQRRMQLEREVLDLNRRCNDVARQIHEADQLVAASNRIEVLRERLAELRGNKPH